MNCRKCNSVNTRVTCTNHYETHTKRYCRCLDCGEKYRTVERYEVAKPIPLEPCVLRGTENPNSKLKSHQVDLIRHLSQKGYSNGQIALRLGVHRSTVCRVANYKTYKAT
jgi:transcriptional regulator NrdR family protein